jgi:hypothetical protein
MSTKKWSWCLFFLILLCGHAAYCVEPPPILDASLQISRWGFGRKVFSFSTNEQCGQLSVTAAEGAPRVWMLYIRMNGRHLVLRFPGHKSGMIFSRQVKLRAENNIHIVMVGRPRAKFSVRIQPCAPSPAPPTARLTLTENTIHHPNDCDHGVVEADRCSTTLNWNSTNADECRIAPDIGKVDCSGSIKVSPLESTTYVLTASGDGGSVTASADILVVHFPQAELTTAEAKIVKGEPITLNWSTTYADSVEIQPGIGAVASEGTCYVPV